MCVFILVATREVGQDLLPLVPVEPAASARTRRDLAQFHQVGSRDRQARVGPRADVIGNTFSECEGAPFGAAWLPVGHDPTPRDGCVRRVGVSRSGPDVVPAEELP